jgi:hypothetical protein
VILKMI